MPFILYFALLCGSFFSLNGAEENGLRPGVKADLIEPTFSDGVLSTEKGGVIEAPDVRIQARKLVYKRLMENETPVCTLYAEGDLILEFGEYYFVGDSLEYDFQTHEGVMYRVRTSMEPWFFGGDRALLHADGSFTLINASITTSENVNPDWVISAEEAHLEERQFLQARNIKFKIYQVPLLWLPRLNTNLDTIFDSPVRYFFKWGGHQGSRASMIYEVFNWNRFKTFLRVDYRIKRGFGGGVETYYRSEDRKEIFNTINYVANDNSLSNPHEHLRYRFQGLYHNLVWDDRVSIDMTWDKLSDRDMATDYNDRGLQLDTAERTKLIIRRQEENRIERLIGHVRVNPFQSVNQELPTFEVSWRPRSLGESGIISNSLIRASYLDFAYGNAALHVHDYSSSRVEASQSFYRPFPFEYFVFTPEAGCLGIYYGNSPQDKRRWLGLIQAGAEIKSAFSRTYYNYKHLLEPYAQFSYITSPTVSPHDHYIFDIDDGWFRSNNLRLGVVNEVYVKHPSGFVSRPLFVDLYTYCFADESTIHSVLPRGYLSVSLLSTLQLRHTIDTGWDFQHGELDHFNVRTDWTVSEKLAISGEYRHRSRWVWRKADPTNFILDAYRSENELVHSPLSDRRDTLLTNLFYQFDPNWAFLFEIRHGWNREHESSYTEFETDLLATLPSAWNMKISYQHKEDDDRVALYFSIGLHKPNRRRTETHLPCLEL